MDHDTSKQSRILLLMSLLRYIGEIEKLIFIKLPILTELFRATLLLRTNQPFVGEEVLLHILRILAGRKILIIFNELKHFN